MTLNHSLNFFNKNQALKTVPDFYFMLTPKAIEELKVIYRKRYGEELNDSQAFEMGNRLLNLFRTVLKSLPGNESTEFNKTKICQQKKK